MGKLKEKDLKYIWHPCSQMKDYEEFPPIVVERGEGLYLVDKEGNRYLDAISSWWVNLFGHNNLRINKIIKEQVDKLEHVIFADFTHEPAVELAERIINLTPERLKKVFFANDGSSAVEIALKLCYQYYQQSGRPEKKKIAALSNSYHGESLGALSVCNLGRYKEKFSDLLMDTIKLPGPKCYPCRYNKDRNTCQADCFAEAEMLLKERQREIAAVIIEPIVQGAAGMNIYPPLYLQKLRKLCDESYILLVADEIAVGFGRTGRMFACEHAGISPDLMTLSKGITSGYLPLSLVLMSDEMYDCFYDDYNKGNSFLHSHSYSGNTLACAVACETLNIFKDEQVLKRNIKKSKMMKSLIEKHLLNLPYIGDFRHIGMIGAVELVKDKVTGQSFNPQERVAYNIYKLAMKLGVIIRPLGDVIYFMPPYIIEEEEIESMIETTREALELFFKNYS